MTEEQRKIVEGALRDGCSPSAATDLAGVPYGSLSADPSLRVSASRARAECVARMARSLTKAAEEGDWRAAESWLKRQERAEWGDSLDLGRLSDDQLDRLAGALLDADNGIPVSESSGASVGG